MASFDLHKLVLRGELTKLREILAQKQAGQDINAYDQVGYTPLMYAVNNPEANVNLVKLLLEQGADIHPESRAELACGANVMALALGGGSPEIVSLLLQHGGDIHYSRSSNYSALLHAVHSRDILRDSRLINLLKLLIDQKVELNGISDYAESGLRVLSRIGRFDAVKLLLDAGADASQLQWTPLMRAIAMGSLADVESEVKAGAPLEETDWWQRTPWLLAIQTGDVAKAAFLREKGAFTGAKGRCDKPPLFYAIESNRMPMLRWLLEIGMGIEETDEFGSTPLMEAVENNSLEAVDELLKAGASLDREKFGQTALKLSQNREIILRLLAAGGNLGDLTYESHRALLGMNPEGDMTWFETTAEDFRGSWTRRFGTSNPEQLHDKFYQDMIRSGISAFQAASSFPDVTEDMHPVWCARRFGQSLTFMPDGRIIQIAGEHEDSYDSDFCIYNDIFVHHPNGTVDIFGYPEALFPPTDFHTATLLAGRYIWIIGSLGYHGTRLYGKTPVYRLDTTCMRMEKIETIGDCPGWIYRHKATVMSPHEIRISDGKIVALSGNDEVHQENQGIFILDTDQRKWFVR